MTLAIPLSNNGRYNQLRYSLRSITKHHPEITECVLIGGKPDWYNGNHVIHKDYGPDHKEKNIRDKISLVSGSFLFANDDHILLEPIKTTWNKGMLQDNLSARNGNGSYTRLLKNTFEKYGNVPNVDTHCPMWMDSVGVQKTLFDWPRFGVGFKTCYAQENNIESEFMEDCKTDRIPPADRQWFSLTDNFPEQYLAQLFPNKCKFEL